MTKEEQEQFKKEFGSIVYLKSEIIQKSQYISQLHVWDKNGSHEKAIQKAISELEGLRIKYKERLNGKTYEEWRSFSKQLSLLKSKLKTLKNIDSIARTVEKLNELSF